MVRSIWLDADPGHDDAIAILLALNCPQVKLLGISTVHGNAPAHHTWQNALRLLYAFGAPTQGLYVYAGATKPLLRAAKADPEIHGSDGLGGVEGLPDFSDPAVQARIQHGEKFRAIEAMAEAVLQNWKGGIRTTMVTTGPQTNLALFLSVYPDLGEAIEEIIFMGGGVGIGNRSAAAEYNIMCDPEASQIVLDFPVRKIMLPINVTHKVIFTHSLHARLLAPNAPDISATTLRQLPEASSPLRHTLSTMLTFFSDTYKSTFGFEDGPPLHDALTIAYVAQPELFRCNRYRVDVELTGSHATGETVVDIWNYRQCDDTWGPLGKNCLVVESVDVTSFFDFFFECIGRCDLRSPLNTATPVTHTVV